MPTISEVARHAHVSASTVSHVINHTRFVSDEVRARVEAAMQELGYRPNTLARSLRRGETSTLGLVLPDSANPYFAEIARALESAAYARGYSIIICNTENDPSKEAHYVDVLTTRQVDGIIFVAAGGEDAAHPALPHAGPPVVLVDRDLDSLPHDTVLVDNHAGGYLAARCLVEAGCTRLACIAGPSNLTPSAQRLTGFLQALAEAGLECPPERILRGDFHPSSGYQAAMSWFERGIQPDGIFACNDLMAMGVLSAAAESGRSVPQEISIVGFDDIELASYTTPPLTTIAQPIPAIALQAVACLVERITANSHPPQRLVLPVKLAQRGSTRRFP